MLTGRLTAYPTVSSEKDRKKLLHRYNRATSQS
jgi:hypothetical protein